MIPFVWSSSRTRPRFSWGAYNSGMLLLSFQMREGTKDDDQKSAWTALDLAGPGRIQAAEGYRGSSVSWQCTFTKSETIMGELRRMTTESLPDVYMGVLPTDRVRDWHLNDEDTKYMFKVGSDTRGARDSADTRGGKGTGEWQYGKMFCCTDERARGCRA